MFFYFATDVGRRQVVVSDGITDFEARLNLINTMLLQGTQPSSASAPRSGPGLALQVLPPPPSMSSSSFEFEAAAVAVLDSGTRSRDMHAQVRETQRERKAGCDKPRGWLSG